MEHLVLWGFLIQRSFTKTLRWVNFSVSEKKYILTPVYSLMTLCTKRKRSKEKVCQRRTKPNHRTVPPCRCPLLLLTPVKLTPCLSHWTKKSEMKFNGLHTFLSCRVILPNLSYYPFGLGQPTFDLSEFLSNVGPPVLQELPKSAFCNRLIFANECPLLFTCLI